MSAATAAEVLAVLGDDDSFAAYEQLPGVNWSTLRELERSELHYRHRLENPREDTPRLALGRLIHTAVLQPHRLERDYAAFDGDKRTKAWREFQCENADKTCVGQEEMDRARAIAAAVRAHPAAGRLLARGEPERAVVWRDRTSGLVCKSRLDWLTPRTIVELKTATSVDPREFARVAGRLGYHKQVAFQRRGVKTALGRRRPAVRLIAAEIDPPHDVAVFRLDEDALYAGHEATTDLLIKAAACLRKRRWRGRSERVVPLHLPAWAYGDEDNDISDLGFELEVREGTGS